MRRATILAVGFVMLGGCTNEGPAGSIGPVAASATPATTTTVATGPEPRFTPAHLPTAVLREGDPWPSTALDPPVEMLTIDDIWPLDADFEDFSDERAIYESAGFQGGAFAYFPDGEVALVISGAHLFTDAAGARRAFEVVATSFGDADLVGIISGLSSDAITLVTRLDTPPLGDASAGVLATGAESQVVGIVWITDNLLQFVRSAMPLGDETRTAGVLAVAEAMAARASG